MMKLHDMVWFMDQYDNLCHGVVQAIDYENNYCTTETRSARLDRCYPSKDSCLAAYRARHDMAVSAYLDEIKTLEDLVRFMYTHTVAPCEEYTDWDARRAAHQKAHEFGIEIEE